MLLKRKKIIIVIIFLAIIGSYFGWQALRGGKEAVSYVTASVEKGTLIISVEGSGQVSVSDQVDIKPKVSGDITTLYINKDQEVKTGQLLAALDTRDTQKAIRDAEVSLDSAKAKLEELLSEPETQKVRDAEVALDSAKAKLDELLSQPDAKSLLQAENALAQAQRDLDKTEENYEEITTDAERSLAAAYEDGYSAVSSAFFKLSDYMKDLKDVLGTEQTAEKHILSYEQIIGKESSFTQRLLDDYYEAYDLFHKNFAFFGTVFQGDDRDTIYELIDDTLATTKAISQALESARHMFDAIIDKSYSHFTIATHINKMQPKIESDISPVYSNISSLQRIKDTIDDTNKNTPRKIEDAKLSIQSLQEKLDEKKLALEELMAGADPLDIKSQRNIVAQKEDALEELMAGADPLDIKSQRNTVAQKEDALLDAKERLAECFIRAPFDGIVAKINIKKGDTVSSGTVLATLITQQKIAEITLNEIDIPKIKIAQKVTITFDAIDDFSVIGEVAEVDTLGTVSQGVVTYNVKIAFDAQDEGVKPGMSLSAAIITNVKQNALLMPNSAIKQQGDVSYVQAVDRTAIESNPAMANISGAIIPVSNLHTQQIQVGLANDTTTEIIDGLEEGDVVIIQTISSNATQSQSQQKNTGFDAGMMRMMR